MTGLKRAFVLLPALFTGLIACRVAARATDLSLASGPALDLLRISCNKLESAVSYQLCADATVDGVGENGESKQFTNRVTVVVRRPDHLFAQVRGDLHNVNIWYNGQHFTKYNLKEQTKSKLHLHGSLENLLDTLANKYDTTFPLADFLVRDVFNSLTESVTSSELVETEDINGEPCFHLAFTQVNINWDIWVARAGDRLPRKFMITYKTLPNSPKYTAIFQPWVLSPESEKHIFEAAIPNHTPSVPFSIGNANSQNIHETALYR